MTVCRKAFVGVVLSVGIAAACLAAAPKVNAQNPFVVPSQPQSQPPTSSLIPDPTQAQVTGVLAVPTLNGVVRVVRFEDLQNRTVCYLTQGGSISCLPR